MKFKQDVGCGSFFKYVCLWKQDPKLVAVRCDERCWLKVCTFFPEYVLAALPSKKSQQESSSHSRGADVRLQESIRRVYMVTERLLCASRPGIDVLFQKAELGGEVGVHELEC